MTENRDKVATIRDAAAYTLSEAAHYLRLPPATLRSWVVGRNYSTAEGSKGFSPLIKPASVKPPMMSFTNLIEAHVLRALRTEHGVSVKALEGSRLRSKSTWNRTPAPEFQNCERKPGGYFSIDTAS